MPGKRVGCMRCQKEMRSDNLQRHEKICAATRKPTSVIQQQYHSPHIVTETNKQPLINGDQPRLESSVKKKLKLLVDTILIPMKSLDTTSMLSLDKIPASIPDKRIIDDEADSDDYDADDGEEDSVDVCNEDEEVKDEMDVDHDKNDSSDDDELFKKLEILAGEFLATRNELIAVLGQLRSRGSISEKEYKDINSMLSS